MFEDYSITGDQMKAIKNVEKAMKEAEKAGIHFWDNYGSFTAYNAKVIGCPVPDKTVGPQLNYNHIYSLKVKNFHAGNADDQLHVSFK